MLDIWHLLTRVMFEKSGFW